MGIGLILLSYTMLYLQAAAEPVQDRDALYEFITDINNLQKLNWDRSIPACGGWTGVTCNDDGSRITEVSLPNKGLNGVIPDNTLSRLSALEVLSLKLNNISGPFPADLLKLKNLTVLYLDGNNFQGPLPLDFSGWEDLVVLDLSNNGFNGIIPPSVSELTRLNVLDLSNNSLSGAVPDLNIRSLQELDLSNNNLTGAVPPSLVRFPKSAFSGNNVSFGFPLAPFSFQPVNPTPQPQSPKSHKLSTVGIAIGCGAGVVILVALGLSFSRRKKRKMNDNSIPATISLRKTTGTVSSVLNDYSSITFFEGCNLAFDLEDLLRASAVVLGKGNFGTTYRAVLEDTTMVVVKRLREAIVGRKVFEQQMEVIGNIQHDNIAPLRAYYYSKDEKIMIYDFYCHGSLSTMLHARGAEHRVPMNWETRLKIAIGAARGIAHIHSPWGGKLVHGNINASNIFLNSQNYGCVGDLGLATLVSPISPSALHAAGYCAPEIIGTKKVSQAGDVYSFGVLLLEILTGKSPVHPVPGGGEYLHLVTWVKSVVHEEWTGEVFDAEVMRYAYIEDEMVGMLQVGLSCVAKSPEQRPKMGDVVKMLEDIRRANAGNSPCETRTTSSTPNTTPRCEIGSSFRL